MPEIKSVDGKKKIELSVENSVKSYAIVFGYYVNVLSFMPLSTAHYLFLYNHFDLTNCLSIQIHSLALDKSTFVYTLMKAA